MSAELTPDDEKAIEEQVAALNDLHREGKLDANTYYKNLVLTAHEYSSRGAALKAAAVVQGIPLEYFRQVQRKQMTEDPVYAKQAYTLALALVAEGLIHMSAYVPEVNMPAASA